jgi:hypothetical protein
VGRDFKAAVMNMQKDSMVDLSCLRKNWWNLKSIDRDCAIWRTD